MLWLWLPAPTVFWGTKNPGPTQGSLKTTLLCLLLNVWLRECVVILTHKEKPVCSSFVP